MVKTRGGHAFRPRVRSSSPPLAAAPLAIVAPTATPPATADIAPAAPAAVATLFTIAATQGCPAVGSSSDAPAPRRYHTGVGPTPPTLSHPRLARRAPPSKRARTSGPRESSRSRPAEPQSPPHQGIVGVPHLDLSPTSIIRRSYFPCNPILGNADCNERDLHAEVYYDLLDFSQDTELQDLMLLVQQYSMEPFMTPRQFFYPRVVIEFYHTMTSKRKPNPIALHFSIDDRPGILRASDITATFNLSVVLANSAAYRQWLHPSPREIVRLLSRDTTAGTIMFRRQLPPRMRLIDLILRSNLFPLQHIVQRASGSAHRSLLCILVPLQGQGPSQEFTPS